VEAVIAGWVCGYSMSILSTFALVYLGWRATDMGIFARWFPEGTSMLALAVLGSVGTFFIWTMAGMILGSAYEVLELKTSRGILFAPSAAFLIGMTAFALMPLPFLALVWPRSWWLWVAMSAAFLALFGWTMPILAER
jgi:hypothetical protein